MEVYLRKYFWVVIPLVIAVCALFSARAVTQLLVGALPPPAPRRLTGLGGTPSLAQGGRRDLSRVISRNVFCATCEPIAPIQAAADTVGGDPAPGGAEETSGEPVKSELEYQLLATMVSDGGSAHSYAALLAPSADIVAMYGVGSRLGDQATVTEILNRRVLLQNGGRAEYIELAMDDSGSQPRGRPEPAPRSRPRAGNEVDKLNDEVQKGVRSLGANKWEIQRSALNKVLSNTTLLARSARIVPSLKNGTPNGFKLYAIRPGSIYSLIGMQNGDTIQAINGSPMTTPDKALEVYTKVRNASHLTISFARRGQTKTHDYIIR